MAKTDIDRFVLARLGKGGPKPVAPANKHDLLRRAISISPVSRPRPKRKPRLKRTIRRTPSPKWWTGCWRRRTMASAGAASGWTSRATAKTITAARIRIPRGYRPYPNAYAYRDWVIQAFNDDLPYDQFVKAQLAGDLMDPEDSLQDAPGHGLPGLGPWYYDNGSNEVTRADERHDRVDVVTRGFLGLTVACARCHDHKYDPIPQTDYYSLAGVFFNTTYEEYPTRSEECRRRVQEDRKTVDEKQKILQEMQQTL